jgi:hypothetical protein
MPKNFNFQPRAFALGLPYADNQGIEPYVFQAPALSCRFKTIQPLLSYLKPVSVCQSFLNVVLFLCGPHLFYSYPFITGCGE